MKRCITNALIIGVVFGGILAAMAGTPVAAQTAPVTDRQAIPAAEQAYQEALAKEDKTAVDKLLDTDFEWTTAKGKIWTRAEVLKNFTALAAENGDVDQSGMTQRYYGGQVGILFRLDKDPR